METLSPVVDKDATRNSGLLKGCSSCNQAVSREYQKMAETQALSGVVQWVSGGVAKYMYTMGSICTLVIRVTLLYIYIGFQPLNGLPKLLSQPWILPPTSDY